MMLIRVNKSVVASLCITLITCSLYFLGSCTSESSKRVEFYKDGSIKTSSETIDDSILLIREFHQNHKLKHVYTLVNGDIKGISKEFDSIGHLLIDSRWLHNKLHGISQYYYPSGNLVEVINFYNGLRMGDYYEFYDLPDKKIHFNKKYIIIQGKSYPNEIYEYDTTGKLIASSPLVKIRYKVNFDSCVAQITVKLDSADFPEMKIYTGGFNDEYIVDDSTRLHKYESKRSYESKRLTVSFRVQLGGRQDSTIRGVVYNYKTLWVNKNGLSKQMGRNLYWSLLLEGCKRPEITLASKE